jgi:hypothetical protein
MNKIKTIASALGLALGALTGFGHGQDYAVRNDLVRY